MFDTRPALADMAEQIHSCRLAAELTLQQLASRCGVAASTIHKVETQQMVPTVSVLMKIAKGLGRRPEELVRDEIAMPRPSGSASTMDVLNERKERSDESHRVGVWRIDVSHDRPFPAVALDLDQRAIVLVERGNLHLQAGVQLFDLNPGDCIEVEGGRSIRAQGEQRDTASLMLIVSPQGDLERSLGATHALPSGQIASGAASGSPSGAPSSPGSSRQRSDSIPPLAAPQHAQDLDTDRP